MIGDSSVWGTLLRPEETLAARLDGKTIHVDGVELTLDVYNLGYPTLSLSKNALILNRALAYEPDLVIWSMTFESFPIRGSIIASRTKVGSNFVKWTRPGRKL